MCLCVLAPHMENAPVKKKKTPIPQKTTLPISPCLSIQQGVEEIRAATTEATLIFISAKLQVEYFLFPAASLYSSACQFN